MNAIRVQGSFIAGEWERMHSENAGIGLQGVPAGPESGGTLVIRTWFEPDEVPPGFRARITYGPAVGAETTLYAANPDGALSIVREWLQTQTAGHGGG
jgi:hypothetical protein